MEVGDKVLVQGVVVALDGDEVEVMVPNGVGTQNRFRAHKAVVARGHHGEPEADDDATVVADAVGVGDSLEVEKNPPAETGDQPTGSEGEGEGAGQETN